MATPPKPTNVQRLLRERRDGLAAAERRVADVVLEDLESVAFGTVAQLAARAGVSGPTVVRFASRLGFDGWLGLQSAARQEVSQRLRSGEPTTVPATDPLGAMYETGVDNLQSVMELGHDRFDAVAALLAEDDRAVWVLPGERMRASGILLHGLLRALRNRVHLLDGSEIQSLTRLVEVEIGDVFVLVDDTPAEPWVVRIAERAATKGITIVLVAGMGVHAASSLADHVLTCGTRTASIFHTQVATVALAEALAFDISLRRHPHAGARLTETFEHVMSGQPDPLR